MVKYSITKSPFHITRLIIGDEILVLNRKICQLNITLVVVNGKEFCNSKKHDFHWSRSPIYRSRQDQN